MHGNVEPSARRPSASPLHTPVTAISRAISRARSSGERAGAALSSERWRPSQRAVGVAEQALGQAVLTEITARPRARRAPSAGSSRAGTAAAAAGPRPWPSQACSRSASASMSSSGRAAPRGMTSTGHAASAATRRETPPSRTARVGPVAAGAHHEQVEVAREVDQRLLGLAELDVDLGVADLRHGGQGLGDRRAHGLLVRGGGVRAALVVTDAARVRVRALDGAELELEQRHDAQLRARHAGEHRARVQRLATLRRRQEGDAHDLDAGRLVVGRDDGDGARSAVDDALRGAADEPAMGASMARAADDHERRALLLGDAGGSRAQRCGRGRRAARRRARPAQGPRAAARRSPRGRHRATLRRARRPPLPRCWSRGRAR